MLVCNYALGLDKKSLDKKMGQKYDYSIFEASPHAAETKFLASQTVLMHNVSCRHTLP